MQHLTPSQLADWLRDAERHAPVLLDVREPWEYALCHIEGSIHLPMSTVPARLRECKECNEGAPIVVICHHGVRSLQVARFLEHEGYEPVFNLDGGIHAWAQAADTAMPTY